VSDSKPITEILDRETDAEDVIPRQNADDPVREREGLPRGYRMRADKHYVDQLASTSGQPVRLLPLAELESIQSFEYGNLRPLVESIRVHGVIHPLIVRPQGARFAVVAGSRRLAAAQLLHLATVPCLVHDIDDAQAAALAAADNLTIAQHQSAGRFGALSVGVGQVIARHLAAVQASIDILDGVAPMGGPTTDLVRAHAWRAARLIDALDLIGNTTRPQASDRSITRTADQVI